MKNIQTALLALIGIFATVSCALPQSGERLRSTGPQAVIYKTKADYSKNVPVTLSEDGSRIISYPAPQDLYTNGNLAYPTPLAKGYLLDNRGIGPHSAFLSLTYEQYAALASAPNTDDMYKMILDKDPFERIYALGPRHKFRNIVEEANELIVHHKLRGFKRLK